MGRDFPFSRDLTNPGIEPRVPHCRHILYQLSHKGSTYHLLTHLFWQLSWLLHRQFLLLVHSCTMLCCAYSQSCLIFVIPWTVPHQSPLSMWLLHARILEWVDYPFSRRTSQSRNTRSPALQEDYLPAEPPGKPLFITISLQKYYNFSHFL